MASPVLADLRASNANARWRSWRSSSSTRTSQTSSSSLGTVIRSSSSLQTLLTSRFERLKSVPVTMSEESFAATLPLDKDLVELFGPWNATRLPVIRNMQSSPCGNTRAGHQQAWLFDRRIVRDSRLNHGGHEIFDNVNSPRETVTCDTGTFWQRYARSKGTMHHHR